MMGDTGPCGPRSESYTRSDQKGYRRQTRQRLRPRCIEIWNLVLSSSTRRRMAR